MQINEEVLEILGEEKRIINRHSQKMEMTYMTVNTPRRSDKLYIILIGRMIEGTRSRGRSKTKCIDQIMSDVGITSYKRLEDMVDDRETRKNIFCKLIFYKLIFKSKTKIIKSK